MKHSISIFQLPISIFLLAIATACNQNPHSSEKTNQFTCPMHPQIVQDKPGTCPVCGMDLVKLGSPMTTDGSIMLSEQQIRLANISTTLIRKESMGENILLTSRLTVNEDKTEVISSRVNGRIEKMYFKEVGQAIKKGDPLYEIYSETFLALESEYVLALKQMEELKRDRYKSLVSSAEKKLVLLGMSKQQISQLASSRLPDSKIVVYSPASGIISSIAVSEGQYITEGTALYRIENIDHIWIESDLFTGEKSFVSIGDSVIVKITGFENTPSTGIITFLSPQYREGTQVITLRASINNPKHQFMPGMQATVVLSHSNRKVVALPSDAVIRDAKGSHVWILENNGTFKPRVVKTGLENDEKVEITEGIVENENVVITGAYLLYSELVLKRGGDPMTKVY